MESCCKTSKNSNTTQKSKGKSLNYRGGVGSNRSKPGTIAKICSICKTKTIVPICPICQVKIKN